MRMRGIVTPTSSQPSSQKAATTGQPMSAQPPQKSLLPTPHPITQPMQQPTYTRQNQHANTHLPDTRPLTPRNSVRTYPSAPSFEQSQEKGELPSDTFGARQRANSNPFRVTIHDTGDE